jgi:hypothetical protein
MNRSVRRFAATGLTRSVTGVPLIEREAMLLRKQAEQPSGMHKYNLFGAGQAASLAFRQL